MTKKVCLDCGKEFSPNHGKQKFCSDKCKLKYSRNKKRRDFDYGKKLALAVTEKLKIDVEEKEVPNNIIMTDWKKVEPKGEFEYYEYSWQKAIADYCQEVGIEPEELIEVHKKISKIKSTAADVSNFKGSRFFNELRKKKLNI